MLDRAKYERERAISFETDSPENAQYLSQSWAGPKSPKFWRAKSYEDRAAEDQFISDDETLSNLSSKSLPAVLNPHKKPLLNHRDVQLIHKRYNPRVFLALQTQRTRRRYAHDDFLQRLRLYNKYSCCSPISAMYRWWILLTVSFIPFGTYVFYYSISALNTDLKEGLGIDDSQLGVLYSVSNIANVFMVLLAGIAVDKFGLRKSSFVFNMLVAIGGIVFCLGVGPWFKSYYMLVAGRFIFGIGCESAYVVQDTVTAMWFRGKDISIALGFATSAGGLGEIVSFGLLAQMVEWFDSYVLVFWFAGIMCVLCLVSALVYIVLDYRAETADTLVDGEESSEHFHISMILQLPLSYWLITIICVLYFTSIFSFMSFGPGFLQMKYNWSQVDAGRVTALIGVCSTVLSPLLGWILDRHGKHAIVVSFGTFCLSCLFILFDVSVMPSYYPIVGVGGIGISYAMVSAAIWPCMVACVDTEIFGTAYGLATALISVGTMIANWIIGKLMGSHMSAIIMMWAGMSATALLVSVIWNIMDSSTGGLYNSPADEREEEEDEEIQTDDEDPYLVTESRPLLN